MIDDATIDGVIRQGADTVGQAHYQIALELRERRDAEALQYKPPKVSGCTSQPDAKVALVNEFKEDEERLLRKIGALPVTDEVFLTGDVDRPLVIGGAPVCDPRWIAIARSHFEQGFMALNRAVFQPQRIKLPEDE